MKARAYAGGIRHGSGHKAANAPSSQMRLRGTNRRATLMFVAALAVIAVGIVWHRGDDGTRTARPATSHRSPVAQAAARLRVIPRHLHAQAIGRLASPVQDAAAVALGQSRALLLGGLTAADRSTNAVNVVSNGRSRPAGRLPVAVHDAAATRLGGAVYVFGGGDGSAQHDEI